jgi:hypothetical protein
LYGAFSHKSGAMSCSCAQQIAEPHVVAQQAYSQVGVVAIFGEARSDPHETNIGRKKVQSSPKIDHEQPGNKQWIAPQTILSVQNEAMTLITCYITTIHAIYIVA